MELEPAFIHLPLIVNVAGDGRVMTVCDTDGMNRAFSYPGLEGSMWWGMESDG